VKADGSPLRQVVPTTVFIDFDVHFMVSLLLQSLWSSCIDLDKAASMIAVGYGDGKLSFFSLPLTAAAPLSPPPKVIPTLPPAFCTELFAIESQSMK